MPSFSSPLPAQRNTNPPKRSVFPDLYLKRDLRWATLSTWRYLKHHWIWVGVSLVAILLLLVFGTFPNDIALFQAIRGNKDPQVREVAHLIGKSGSLAQYNIAIVFGFWILGFSRKSRYLQKLAVMVFVSTVFAGLTCNVFRVSLGRPRPFTKVDPSQFQGPQLKARFHGFPSGHTSTAFGTAVPVFTAMPAIGAPVLAYAAAMGWARIYDKSHYPSDVLAGAYLGALFGLAGGIPLARAHRRAKRLARYRASRGSPEKT